MLPMFVPKVFGIESRNKESGNDDTIVRELFRRSDPAASCLTRYTVSAKGLRPTESARAFP